MEKQWIRVVMVIEMPADMVVNEVDITSAMEEGGDLDWFVTVTDFEVMGRDPTQ